MSDEKRTWIKAGVFTIDDQEFHGELQYHATDGLELIVQGPGRFAQKYRDYPIVHGMLEGSTPVTLIDCFDTNIDFNFAGFVRRRVTANYVLEGLHLTSAHAPQFLRMDFRSPSCSQWYAQSGINVGNLKRSGRVSFDVRYRQPPRIRHKLDALRSLELWSLPTYPSGPDNDGNMMIAEAAETVLRYTKRRSLSEALEDIRALDMFYCLAAGSFSGPPEISLWINTVRKTIDDRKRPNKLYISQYWYKEKQGKHLGSRTLLFSDMRRELKMIVTNLFEKWEKLSRLTSLYLTSQEGSSDLLLTFLNLCQALEGLHRACHSSMPITDKEFKHVRAVLKNAIPNDISKEARQFFKDRLPQWNEPGLRGRLKHLFRELNAGEGKLFLHVNEDIDLIVRFRNDFTHVLGAQITDEDIKKLSYLVHLMDLLFVFSLFRIVGVDTDMLRDAYQRNGRYSGLERYRQESFQQSNRRLT